MRPSAAGSGHVAYTARVGPIAAAWARLSASTRSATFEGKAAPAEGGATSTAEAPLSAARKWTITAAVMLVTIMQVLDVTVTNVALPHIQGSLSAAVDEVSWVLTSYLAANAIILPATGWLAGVLGRKRFFLACTVVFTLASMLCGLAPNIETLLVARDHPGHRRRAAHAAVAGHHVGDLPAPAARHGHGGVGRGHHDGAHLRPHPRRLDLGQLVVALDLLHQPAHRRGRPASWRARCSSIPVSQEARTHRRHRPGAHGRRASSRSSSCSTRASATSGSTPRSSSSWPSWPPSLLVGFVVRELTADEPILDLSVYADRNFAAGSVIMLVVMIGFFSSMVLIALFTQKVLGYDAWTSGLVLAPGGVGNLLSLLIAGRLITRMDQRWLLALGCLFNAYATYEMSTITLSADYWALAWPRLIQGVGMGFIFVPLNTVALATISRERMGNATALLNVVRNLGGAIGVALRHHAAGPAQPDAPGHAGLAHQRVGRGDGGAAAGVGRRTS